MPNYPHQNPVVVPPGDIWDATPPPDNPTGGTTEEMKRLDRIMHPRPDHFEETQRLADEARDRFFGAGRPTASLGDNRPNRPEADKFIDAGPCKYTGRHHYPRPIPTRNPNEFRSEALARAEVDRLKKDDPKGNFMIVNGSPAIGDLWIVCRRGEVQQILDAATGKTNPTGQEW
jgi:hypothetical protein